MKDNLTPAGQASSEEENMRLMLNSLKRDYHRRQTLKNIRRKRLRMLLKKAS